jgi:hypothetical protein
MFVHRHGGGVVGSPVIVGGNIPALVRVRATCTAIQK